MPRSKFILLSEHEIEKHPSTKSSTKNQHKVSTGLLGIACLMCGHCIIFNNLKLLIILKILLRFVCYTDCIIHICYAKTCWNVTCNVRSAISLITAYTKQTTDSSSILSIGLLCSNIKYNQLALSNIGIWWT